MSLGDWLGRSLGHAVGSYHRAVQDARLKGAVHEAVRTTNRPLLGSPAARWTEAERYLVNDDVYAAVSLLADNASTVPFEVWQGEAPVAHPLADRLRDPNEEQGAQEFWFGVYAHLLLGGEVYLKLETGKAPAPWHVTSMWAFGGHEVEVVTAKRGPHLVDHYLLRGERGRPIVVRRDEMVPIRLWNPFNAVRGLSPLSALELGLDAEWWAKRSNREIFSNGLGMPGFIAVDAQTPVQLEQVRAELDRNARGEGNRHKVPVFAGKAISFVSATLTPQDAQFVQLDAICTTDVAKVYRVPPPFLGRTEAATYNNLRVYLHSLWVLGILPHVQRVGAALQRHVASRYPDSPELGPDLRGVEALRFMTPEQAKVFDTLVRDGVDPAVAWQEAVGRELPEGAIVGAPLAAAQPGAQSDAEDDTGAGTGSGTGSGTEGGADDA